LREERRLREFENRMLRGLFGPERDEVTREWRKLHNEEHNDLYCLPNIVRVIKIEKNEMGGACSTCGGEESFLQRHAVVTLREVDHLEDPALDERIILK